MRVSSPSDQASRLKFLHQEYMLSFIKNMMWMHQKMNKFVSEENENITTKTHANQPSLSATQQPFSIPLPFPPKIIPRKKMGNLEELDKDLLDIFRKVEVKIPLLDAIKQIPRIAKFLKELCTHKRKLKGNQRINMGRNVSAMIVKKNLPNQPGGLDVVCGGQANEPG
ncbi:hypothetical protein Lal_00032019 [Lupinus albus]|nr:hypothetical protein Lal_00032019 [Lupinus albus]